ncbi:hypothetical protein ACFV1B_11885 [Streptomyces sp. NPDC059637]
MTMAHPWNDTVFVPLGDLDALLGTCPETLPAGTVPPGAAPSGEAPAGTAPSGQQAPSGPAPQTAGGGYYLAPPVPAGPAAPAGPASPPAPVPASAPGGGAAPSARPAAKDGAARRRSLLAPQDQHRLALHSALIAAGIPPMPGDGSAIRAIADLEPDTVRAILTWIETAAGR